jgi:hypothetical protein
MGKWMKRTGCVLMGVASLALPALVVWIAADGRNRALFAWNPFFRNLFFLLVLLALCIPLGVGLSMRHRRSRKKASQFGPFSYVLVVVGLSIALGIPVFQGSFSSPADKDVQLLLADRTDPAGNPMVAVVWYTAEPSVGSLAYGLSESTLDHWVYETEERRSHVLFIGSLDRGTTCYYRIGSEDAVRSFPYFPDPSGPVRLAVSSDAHVGAGTNDLQATADILSQVSDRGNGYSLFCNLGDAVELGNLDSQIEYQIARFSPYTASIPVIQAIGNHDAWFGGFRRWLDCYYAWDRKPYHRFDLADTVHVITLDLEWGTESYDKAQQAWFEAQLDAIDPDDTIIVMEHAYLFASSTEYQGIPWYDNREMIDTFHSLFVRHGVDLVFSGHDHQMEHISRDGVDYFVVGVLGGAFDDEPTFVSDGSLYRNFSDHGYADLSVWPDRVSVVLRKTDGTGVYSWSKTL